ncbi:hypothetical protein MNBD_BACTEROID03-2274 [hydrothermal vent metagenome]|uniref:DUF6892 domain-containing protein n=1 Tax=hydrothermal vent metagenome TaxID=652676 RepID=A0A3B0TIH9_9ZZZZ
MMTLTTNKKLLTYIERIRNPSFNKKETLKFGQKQEVDTVENIQNEWPGIIWDEKIERRELFDEKCWFNEEGNELGDDEISADKCCDNDLGEYRDGATFEEDIYELLINWTAKIDWTDLEEVRALYYYTEIISNFEYDPDSFMLSKYHEQLLQVIKTLIKTLDFKIISAVSGGNFGELAENIVNLYFYQNLDHYATPLASTEIATLIPEFIKAFPKNHLCLILCILENHPEPQKAYADLLRFYMRNDVSEDAYCPLSSKLFGIDNELDEFYHKDAPNIIKSTIQNNEFSNKEIDYLIENVLLSELKLTNKEVRIKALETHILKLKKRNGEQSIINMYEKELSKTIQNWDAAYKKNREKAIRRIAMSTPTFKSMELIVEAYPNHPKTSILKELLTDAESFKNKPKTYTLDTNPKTVFKDFHLKLLVIEELMYKQAVLLPIFALNKFKEEYPERDFEEFNGINIAEVEKYFKNLDIPAELLAKATSLYQASDLYSDVEFAHELCPDWDPGAGDEVFKITNKTIDDLELLPNLKKIIGIEASEPSEKLIKAFETRGVVLETEDD